MNAAQLELTSLYTKFNFYHAVVPRLLFDGWLPQQIEELQDAKAREKIVKLITNVVKV